MTRKDDEYMKIALACDHGALEYKEALKTWLIEEGHEVEDFGTHTKESMDYPDTVAPACESVASGKNERGIVLCSTGVGVSITANKVHGIRCALISDLMSARLTREHNNTNVLAMGQFVIGEALMKEIAKTWLTTEFSNGERHINRINKVMALEEVK